MVALFLLLLSAGAVLGQYRVHSQRDVRNENRIFLQEDDVVVSQGGTPVYTREEDRLYGEEIEGIPDYAEPGKVIDDSDYIQEGKEVTRTADDITLLEEEKMYRSVHYMKISGGECALWDLIVDKKALKFNLFTRDYENGKGFFQMRLNSNDNLLGLENSNFNKSRPTKIFIHNWQQTGTPRFIPDLPTYGDAKYVVKAYMKKEDVNLIMVDWSKHSNCEYFYTTRYIVPNVGLYISKMIKNLIEKRDANIMDMHVIGFGLGAHVASYVSQNLQPQLLPRITGVDPLGPGYYNIQGRTPKRLSQSDAKFVDIIHSNEGSIGILANLGHVDFYLNGGNAQPGCPINRVPEQYIGHSFGAWHSASRGYPEAIQTVFAFLKQTFAMLKPLISLCSHKRGLKLFAESIVTKTGFYSLKCGSYKDFRARKCEKNDMQPMGEYVSTNATGKYYLQTHNRYPFAMGEVFQSRDSSYA